MSSMSIDPITGKMRVDPDPRGGDTRPRWSNIQARIASGEELPPRSEWVKSEIIENERSYRPPANPTQPSELREMSGMSVLVDPREPTQDQVPPTPTAPTLEPTNIFGQTADEAAETGPMQPRYNGSPGKGIRSQPQYGGGFGGYQPSPYSMGPSSPGKGQIRPPFAQQPYGGGFGGGFGGYQPPMYGGGGYSSGPGKGRASSGIPSQNAYYDENRISKLTKEDPYGLIPYKEPVQTPPPATAPPAPPPPTQTEQVPGRPSEPRRMTQPSFYGSPGKGMRPQPYGGGFGGYQQPFYGGGFGGGYSPQSMLSGIGSLQSNYSPYMPQMRGFNPYMR
jgi:hypothetical protein